ncbi:hypothetical protein EJB05_39149, partial [Eragrostis curvula]
MAQPPHDFTEPVFSLDPIEYTADMLPPGMVFDANGRCLIDNYLIPKALHGRLPDDSHVRDAITECVDIYAVRPEALPFPNRQRREPRAPEFDPVIWGYFFAKRPAAAAAGLGAGGGGGEGSEGDTRDVAAGGCWRRSCNEKAYVGEDGEVYAFRNKFTFHEPAAEGDGELTPWRMKEFCLDEAAPTFRDVTFHPSAKDLVILKIYHEADIPEEEPDVEYYTDDNDDYYDFEEVTAGDVISVPAARAA